MNEFQLIETYFQGLLPESPTTRLGIGDDAAIIQPLSHHDLVIAVDTLVENRHFFATDIPANIAHKALAVNLSDIAAMGAQPIGFLLALTLPEINTHWLENFSQGLKDLAQRYQLSLLGGDTTRGPLTISITVMGQIPEGQALKRGGAKVGDGIYVSGTLGAAAMVVKQQYHQLNVPAPELEEAFQLYRMPQPQIELGLALRGVASSCIDISDGLAQDCLHILKQSNVGASVDVDKIPVHPTLMRSLPRELAQKLALTGGDDYQLLFTANDLHHERIQHISQDLNITLTRIGQITPGHTFILLKQGDELDWDLKGYDHFESIG